MKIVTILGARPQFVKAGTVSREILKMKVLGHDLEEVIIHTGQHYDRNMSDIFFSEMRIPKPNYFLGVGGSTHGAMTGQMIEKIEEVLLKEQPDWVLVYGDTNSTLAGTIAATKLNIKIAHIEAGLRSFNMRMPEEVNRILTDRVSDVLFCPTKVAMDNLRKEGVENWNTNVDVILSGDVMQDGALFYKEHAVKPIGIDIQDNFILCTIHRAENTDDRARLESILAALNQIAKERQIILPLHPRTKKLLEHCDIDSSKLTIIDPVGYLNMVWLLEHCSLVMTDSGGLQKEAFFFSKPCITMRDETEWVELVESGVNQLVGADKDRIMNALSAVKKDLIFDQFLYGNGEASQRIISHLLALS